MRKIKLAAILSLIIFSPLPKAVAKVTVANCQLNNASIGAISSGNSSSLNLDVKSSSTLGFTSGGSKIVRSGNNALLTINTLGVGDALKIFITNVAFNMNGPGAPIATMMSLSSSRPVSGTNTITSIVRASPSNRSVNIYGYATIGANQIAGNYQGNYQVTICVCDGLSCPQSIDDPRCTATPTCTTS